MIFSVDFQQSDIREEPCIMCGEPSSHIVPYATTADKSLATPKGVTRILVFGMCETCYGLRKKFTREEMRTLAENMLREEVRGNFAMKSVNRPARNVQ